MSTETPAIVHLVDDDASFLSATARLLRASGYVVKTYSSASSLLNQLSNESGGCVIADLSMPGQSGLDLQEALAKSAHPLPLIFLTGHADIPASVQAMRRGAEDFLTKRAPKDQLLAAVERALVRGVRERVQREYVRDLRARLAQLTPREREVLDQVVRGKQNKQIAEELTIHERTVKLHRTSITSKLQVHSVAELTRLVLEASLGASTSGGVLAEEKHLLMSSDLPQRAGATFPKGQ